MQYFPSKEKIMVNNGIVRTVMGQAFADACCPDALRGKKLSRTSRKVVHRVLTDMAMGVGVKFDPSRKRAKKNAKQQAADSAVMKVAA